MDRAVEASSSDSQDEIGNAIAVDIAPSRNARPGAIAREFPTDHEAAQAPGDVRQLARLRRLFPEDDVARAGGFPAAGIDLRLGVLHMAVQLLGRDTSDGWSWIPWSKLPAGFDS